jgi:hypothetical protein
MTKGKVITQHLRGLFAFFLFCSERFLAKLGCCQWTGSDQAMGGAMIPAALSITAGWACLAGLATRKCGAMIACMTL